MLENQISICAKCQAKWLDGQLYWSTGAKGDPNDLAGLVCNKFGDDSCINPCKGSTSGDTWEKRLGEIRRLSQEDDQ